MYPGGTFRLVVSIANRHFFDIVVTSLDVEILEPGPGCPSSALIVEGPQLGAVIRRRVTGTVPVTVRMPVTAPDACQGAAFPLRYTVTATKSR